MTVPKSVRAWVADAESTYAPGMDAWFPADFDWRAFCADAPALVERLGGRFAKGTEAAAKARLEELAVAAFRGGTVCALALLAGYDTDANPDDALERLTSPIADDEERERFAALLANLDVVEEILNGARPRTAAAPFDPAVDAALAVLGPVRDVLSEGLDPARRAVVRLGGSAEPIGKAVSGVVTIAVALAGMRHQAAAERDEERGEIPLRLDLAALVSALVG